jgi:RimJ/RimL family protein N-acetyltransferase
VVLVRVVVFVTNATAIGLYQKLGFIEEGRRIKDIKRGLDSYVDTVMMYKFVK